TRNEQYQLNVEDAAHLAVDEQLEQYVPGEVLHQAGRNVLVHFLAETDHVTGAIDELSFEDRPALTCLRKGFDRPPRGGCRAGMKGDDPALRTFHDDLCQMPRNSI